MIKTHDQIANATYYILEPTSSRTVAKTICISEVCNVDIDSEGYPLGVEVLHRLTPTKTDKTTEV